MILAFVGSKIGKIIVTALVVTSILFIMIQYIQSVERDKVTKQIEIETLQNDVRIRENVDGSVKENREANPNRDGSTALDLLRERQSDR